MSSAPPRPSREQHAHARIATGDHQMQPATTRVLEILAGYEGSQRQLLSDVSLNDALDPFRGIGPVPIHCGAADCNQRVSWWALPVRGYPPFPVLRRMRGSSRGQPEPVPTGFVYGNGLWSVEGARVIHSSRGPRRAEVRGDAGKSVASWHPAPYEDWSVGFVGHDHDADLVDSEELQYRFACRRQQCRATYLLMNKQMLAFLVKAIADGEPKRKLPPQR